MGIIKEYTIKVAVYEGERKITLQERPDPKADPGEVIIKIKYCGICSTNVKTDGDVGAKGNNKDHKS